MNSEIKVNSDTPYKFWITQSHLHYRYIKAQIDIEIFTGREWINAKLCQLTGEQSFNLPEAESVVHETSYAHGIYI